MRPVKLLTVPLAIALALGLAELIARPLFPGPERCYVNPPGMTRTFRVDTRALPGVGAEARFAVNLLGYRGDEPPADPCYRILALGGSTTQCAYLDQERAWPHLVQEALNAPGGRRVWVANAGRSGVTSRRHAVQLRYILSQEPRFDTVLLLVGVNDLLHRLSFGATEPPSAALTAESVSPSSCFALLPRADDTDAGLLERTGLWNLAASLLRTVSASDETEEVGSSYRTWRSHRSQASWLIDELPDLTRALEAYRSNLKECVDTARDHGVRLVLIDQPSLWRADLPEEARRLLWTGGVGEYKHRAGLPYYSVRALAEGMRRYNQALREFAAKEGVELAELAEKIPKEAAFFYDDAHFNEAGSQSVGAEVVAYLLAQPPHR